MCLEPATGQAGHCVLLAAGRQGVAPAGCRCMGGVTPVNWVPAPICATGTSCCSGRAASGQGASAVPPCPFRLCVFAGLPWQRGCGRPLCLRQRSMYVQKWLRPRPLHAVRRRWQAVRAVPAWIALPWRPRWPRAVPARHGVDARTLNLHILVSLPPAGCATGRARTAALLCCLGAVPPSAFRPCRHPLHCKPLGLPAPLPNNSSWQHAGCAPAAAPLAPMPPPRA